MPAGLHHALTATSDAGAVSPPVAGTPVGPAATKRSVIDELLDEEFEGPAPRPGRKVGRGEDTVNGGRTALANYFARVSNGAKKRL